MTKLLGIDIGTTHCKVGLFHIDGHAVKIVTKQTSTHYNTEGQAYYVPEEILDTVTSAINEVTVEHRKDTTVVGITSMAETGVLMDGQTGLPKTNMIPWFDQRSLKQAKLIDTEIDAFKAFKKTGLHNSYKYGLAKLLWLEEHYPEITKNALWLSVADYIAYKLTGKMGTDYSLAARTFAFRIDTKEWDDLWLRHFGLTRRLFPEAAPSGIPVGNIPFSDYESIGLIKGTPVAVSGHDHVCAAMAVGAIQPGTIFDSIGTAETLIGTLESGQLGEKEFKSGLSFGCHVVSDHYFWMGSIPDSGGSVEWVRERLSDTPFSYEALEEMLEGTKQEPTGILYYPYFSKSKLPHRSSIDLASFIGLKKSHQRADLIKAVFEGTAYELEAVKNAAETIFGQFITRLISVGGGTKNKAWMQIKADVLNCHLSIPYYPEATLLGAALIAAVGSGIYSSEKEATSKIKQDFQSIITPDADRHQAYQHVYNTGYRPILSVLNQFYC